MTVFYLDEVMMSIFSVIKMSSNMYTQSTIIHEKEIKKKEKEIIKAGLVFEES